MAFYNMKHQLIPFSRSLTSNSFRIRVPCLQNCVPLHPQLRPAHSTNSTPSAYTHPSLYRCLHTNSSSAYISRPPKSRDRGPRSTEDTQTDFDALDVLRNTVAPATSIDACTSDGFALNNMARMSGCGVLLVGGEAFRWRPWLRGGRREGTIAEGGEGDDAMTGRLKNERGQFEVAEEAWGVLELIYPKPGMLLLVLCKPARKAWFDGLTKCVQIFSL